jgi:hypothetical protein
MIKWRKHCRNTVETIQKSNKKIVETEGEIPCFIYNIFVMFGTCVFQQIVGIPMCSNLFSSACFYIRVKQNTHQCFWRTTKRNYSILLISLSAIGKYEYIYSALVLFELSICIDWINVCYIRSLTKDIAFLVPDSCWATVKTVTV